MILQSLKSCKRIIRTKNVKIVYKLIFQNTLYSLECYKEGSNKEDLNNYCLVENVTDDEGEAEAFLRYMAKGNVFPVHIKDTVDDYFSYL